MAERRERRCFAALVLAFVAFRAAAVLTLPPARFTDSATYERLDLLGRSGRLWVVPAVYNLVGSDHARVLVQLVLAIAAWTYAAWGVGRVIERPVLRLGAQAGVLAVGLSRPIMAWDSMILSESLSLSLLVVMVSAWLQLAREHRRSTLGIALVASSLWIHTRHVNVLIAVAIVAVVALGLWIRRADRLVFTAAVASLVLMVVWGLAAFSGSEQIRHYNSLGIIAERMLPDAQRKAYLERQGLEMTPELAAVTGRFGVAPSPTDRDTLQWIDRRWTAAYATYLLAHPSLGIGKPSAALPGLLTFPIDRYYRADQQGMPGAVEALVYGDHPIVLWSWLAAAVGLLGLRARRGRLTALDAAPWVGVIVAGLGGILVWQLSASDLPRLELPVAVAVRLGLLVSVALSCDRLSAPRRRLRPEGAWE